MLVFYVIAIFVRPAPGPLAIWVRIALCVYVGIGVVFGPRFTWRALRLYTVGLAVTLNLATGSVVG
jgi:type IV secretory pathway VirB2 component (pilin)